MSEPLPSNRLVQLLREDLSWSECYVTMREAADEIERLTRALADVRMGVGVPWYSEVLAERDRLRAALELVESEIHRPISAANMAQEMWHHAKKALGEPKP